MPSNPLSHWVGFHIYLLLLLAAEFGFARRSSPVSLQKSHRTALAATALWVSAALVFSLFILHTLGKLAATQYLAGYAIEESLSIDNLFIFLLLFRVFRIESQNQPRVLFWGVSGAILMRAFFIVAGLELLARFHWMSYLFAVILLVAAVRLLLPSERTTQDTPPAWIAWLSRLHPVSPRQDRFFVREDDRRMATVLFLALIAIELTDIVFALDSIPAVLSITRHPFLAYTSNIMAVMGLRSLYFLLAHLLGQLRFLHFGLAAVLAFAALKMLSAPWFDVGPLISLFVIATLLAATVAASAFATKHPGISD